MKKKPEVEKLCLAGEIKAMEDESSCSCSNFLEQGKTTTEYLSTTCEAIGRKWKSTKRNMDQGAISRRWSQDAC